MAVVSEDGTGVAGAEIYGTIAQADAYWAARPHDPLAAAWSATAIENKEGAAREAAAYLDGFYGRVLLGYRATVAQGLAWPRNGGYVDGVALPLVDSQGLAVPGLPPALIRAQAELAARAITIRLAADTSTASNIKSKQFDVFKTEFFEGPSIPSSTYGIVAGIMREITAGDPGAAATWFWA